MADLPDLQFDDLPELQFDKQPTNPFISALQSAGKVAQSGIPSPTNLVGQIPGMNIMSAQDQVSEQIKQQSKEATGFKTPIISDLLFDPRTYQGLAIGEKGLQKVGESGRELLGNIKTVKTGATEFADNIRKAFLGARKSATDQFGGELERLTTQFPDRTVSIAPHINDIIVESSFNPTVKSAINRSPTLKAIVNNPELANNIPLKETQKIINELKIPKNIQSQDIPLVELKEDIRASQLDAFPEMEQVRGNYKDVINNYNLVKGKIRQGKLLSNIANDWGDPEIKKAAESLLTKDLQESIKGYQNAQQVLKAVGLVGRVALKAAVGTGVAGAIGGAIYKGVSHR